MTIGHHGCGMCWCIVLTLSAHRTCDAGELFAEVVYAFSVLRRAYACVKRVWMSCGDRDG